MSSVINLRILHRRLLAIVVAAATMLVAGAIPASAGPPGYRVVDIGTLSGKCCSEATAINDRGVVVGNSSVGGPFSYTHAFAWRHGRMTDLGTLGGRNSWATDVNNRGEVVGYSDLPNGTWRGFLWRAGRLVDLGTLGGDSSFPTGINERGDIVGNSTVKSGQSHPFRWRDGKMRDLGAPVGGYARASAINERGDVVGETSVDAMNTVPVRWRNGATLRLTNRFGTASAVNDRGQVAGFFYSGFMGSFLWSRDGLVDLGKLPGATVMQAQGVNNRGQVVGYSDFDAFLWQRGRLRALPRLAGSTSGAAAINDRGQVVGYSATAHDGTNYHAVLWTR